MKPKDNLYPMLDVEDALDRFLSHFEPLEAENVPILEAMHRVLAEEIVASMDIPPLANSAMDGYAVRCADTDSAHPDHPCRLHVVANLAAGYTREQPVEPGTAVRIMTGAPVPPGTEAVIPFEEVETEGNEILIFDRPAFHNNIRAAGEDVKAGQVVLTQGQKLTPPAIGMLAALGCTEVSVHRRPRVALLSTGDEVIEPDAPWQPGKIRDANGFSNAAQVLACGGIPLRLGIACDTVDELTARIKTGLDQNVDLLITSGGVSVGEFDVVKTVLAAQGKIEFWRVRMKPGKPLAFGRIRGVPLLGLPGNPVAAIISFELFARPVISKMLGETDLSQPLLDAVLVDEIKHKDNWRHFVRVTLEERNETIYAHLTGAQGSGMLLSMVKADGLAIIPEAVNHMPSGSSVKVIRLT